MGYNSKNGRRPIEYASKFSHSEIINEKKVESFLDRLDFPEPLSKDEVKFNDIKRKLNETNVNNIEYVVTIDGGYSPVPIKNKFPSSTICFYQIGALIFEFEDLTNLKSKPFIDPKDIKKLKDIERHKFVMPVKNTSFKGDWSLLNTIRKTIFDFFINEPEEDYGKFIETLKWFVFEEYKKENPRKKWILASCPHCNGKNISVKENELKNYKFNCNKCGGEIFLTDLFRLHEEIDEDQGASGILGYVSNLLEQMTIIHLIKVVLEEMNNKGNFLQKTLFIKDGPLGFFGQTANMHKPMRKLMNFLKNNYDINLVGIEKSGPFNEHADRILEFLDPKEYLMLDENYIYKYIKYGTPDLEEPYGSTSNYGNKIIFKMNEENIYVFSIPTRKVTGEPQKDDFINLDIILNYIQKLRCDMFDNSILSVALVNQLVSLSDHPSSKILEKFAQKSIGE